MYYHLYPCTAPEHRHRVHPCEDYEYHHPVPPMKPEKKECEPMTNIEINEIIEKVYINEV